MLQQHTMRAESNKTVAPSPNTEATVQPLRDALQEHLAELEFEAVLVEAEKSVALEAGHVAPKLEKKSPAPTKAAQVAPTNAGQVAPANATDVAPTKVKSLSVEVAPPTKEAQSSTDEELPVLRRKSTVPDLVRHFSDKEVILYQDGRSFETKKEPLKKSKSKEDYFEEHTPKQAGSLIEMFPSMFFTEDDFKEGVAAMRSQDPEDPLRDELPEDVLLSSASDGEEKLEIKHVSTVYGADGKEVSFDPEAKKRSSLRSTKSSSRQLEEAPRRPRTKNCAIGGLLVLICIVCGMFYFEAEIQTLLQRC